MFKKIYKTIKQYNNIIIARHIGADPDALGSQLALRESIKAKFPNKNVYAVGNTSVKFDFFPKLDKVQELNDCLLIVVDTPDKKRVDVTGIDNFDCKIKIDHHPWLETYCDIEYIDDTSSSASELILKLINNTPLIMNDTIATLIYYGIVSDTNRFLFSIYPETFELVSNLLKKYELDLQKIYTNLYNRPLNEVRLQGHIALNMKVTENGLAYIKLSNDDLNKYGVDVGSAGNMINSFNHIIDILVWVVVTEDVKNDLIKINIRSRGPVINYIAEKYNGGGHKYASGAKVMTMDLADSLLKELDNACLEFTKESEYDKNEDK